MQTADSEPQSIKVVSTAGPIAFVGVWRQVPGLSSFDVWPRARKKDLFQLDLKSGRDHVMVRDRMAIVFI